MTALLVTTAAALVGGAILVAIGLRGRRVDDHPICRRCGRDWYGTSAERCPECGVPATNDNRRIGNRERRPRPLWAGVAVLTIGILTAAPLLAGLAGVDVDRHKPLWLLIRESRHSPTAAAEIDRRHVAGDLDADAVARVAVRWLDHQGDRDLPWIFEKGDLLFRLARTGGLTASQSQRLIEQAYAGDIAARRRARSGGELPVVRGLAGTRGDSSNADRNGWSFSIPAHLVLVRDGRRFAGRSVNGTLGQQGMFGASYPGEIDLRGVPPGEYGLAFEYDPADTYLDAATLADPSPPPAPVIPVTVVPANEPTAETVDDPASLARVRGNLRLDRSYEYGLPDDAPPGLRVDFGRSNRSEEGEPEMHRYSLQFDTSGLLKESAVPLALAYEVVLIDPAGRVWADGDNQGLVLPAGNVRWAGAGVGGDLSQDFDADRVDVILRPSVTVAERSLHAMRILGGEVVFEDVPVLWVGRPEPPAD